MTNQPQAYPTITPTIGRIVLYTGQDEQVRPAIITHAWSDVCVNLFVFPKDLADADHGPKTAVVHRDPGADPRGGWAWMGYQIAMAAQATNHRA